MGRQETPDIMNDVLAAKPWQLIRLREIKTDGGTQMRAKLDDATVAEYSSAITDSGKGIDVFPPIVVYYDGAVYWLADGFHRVAAFREHLTDSTMVRAEVRAGSKRDAVLFAAGANASHGLRREPADKRRSVDTLLRDEEWSQWSDREIARRCNVHHQLVATIRASLDDHPVSERTYTTKHGTAATMQTANIGSGRTSKDRQFYGEPPAAATPTADEPDPWRVAYNRAAGSRQAVVERLARALMPWLKEYRDEYGRTWQEIAARGNVAHTNSTLWQDIQKEQQRRGLDMSEGILKDAIKQTFNWLASAASLQSVANAVLAQPLPAKAEPEPEPAQPAGKPMLSIFLTDEEREIEAGEAAADEAARQVLAEQAQQAARSITPAAPLPIAIKPVVALVDGPPLPDWAAGELVPVSQRNDYDSDEWYTPAEYIDAARAVMGSIDLDPASSDLAQTIVQAKCHLTKTENGLAMARWLAQTVWLNPPYSNPAVWVAKLVAEHQAGPFVIQAIVLVNNATETAWFQSLLERYPVCLPAKRLAFWRHDQSGLTARQGQAFFYLGPNVAEFTAIFGQFGPVLRRFA